MLTKFAKPLRNQSGFTLVEMLVVIAITGIIVVMISEIFVNIVQSSTNATVTNEVRSDGQVAMERIARNVRNSDQIQIAGSDPITVTRTNTMTVDVAGVATTYTLDCTKLLENGNPLTSPTILMDTTPAHCSPLNPADVGQYSYFEITPRVGSSPPQVKIALTLYTKSGPGFHSEYATRQSLSQSVVQLGQYKK